MDMDILRWRILYYILDGHAYIWCWPTYKTHLYIYIYIYVHIYIYAQCPHYIGLCVCVRATEIFHKKEIDTVLFVISRSIYFKRQHLLTCFAH